MASTAALPRVPLFMMSLGEVGSKRGHQNPAFAERNSTFMNKLALCGLVLAVAACQSKSGGASSPDAPLANDDEKALYALGVTVANRSQMPQLKFTPAELEIVQRGIGDAAAGNKPEVPMETYGPKAQALVARASRPTTPPPPPPRRPRPVRTSTPRPRKPERRRPPRGWSTRRSPRVRARARRPPTR